MNDTSPSPSIRFNFTPPDFTPPYFTPPDVYLQLGYQISAGVFGILNAYLFIALLVYERCIPNKPRNGRKLRVLCLLAVFTAVLHQILQQLIVTLSGKSTPACAALMATKSTFINAIISFTYAFLWLRQEMFYSNPQLHGLRGRRMQIATWSVLGLLIVNPCVMLGFQFNGELYRAVNGTCLVMDSDWPSKIPFILVVFSYIGIQATLVFMYFYPLYNRNIPQSSPVTMVLKDYQANSAQSSPCMITKMSHNDCISPAGDLKTVCTVSKPVTPTTILQTRAITKCNERSCDGRSVRSLQARMKRWMILSVICVVSDLITASTIAAFLLFVTPSSVISLLFVWHDISMFINVVCLIGCFKDFHLMVFPFLKLFKTTPPPNH